MASYKVESIDAARMDLLVELNSMRNLYSSKADINGVCVELFTDNREFIEMWDDNFYHMSDSVRAHARIYCMTEEGTELHAEYYEYGSVMFLFNFDYYGWVKSIALGLAGNILEDTFGIYSVHGAAIDIDGSGVTLIAPSKTGKTTQSWGLLRLDHSHLISDDWYFVSFGCGRPNIHGSERNCYIDADIGDVWEEYKDLVKGVKFDGRGRGIGNVRWVTGEDSVINRTSMRKIFLLKRDPTDSELVRRMDPMDALAYLEEHDFCNPHQLVRDERRLELRRRFFLRYLSLCDVYMVNTTCCATDTQENIRNVIGGDCR